VTIARIDRLVVVSAALDQARDFYQHRLGGSPSAASGTQRLALDFCGVSLEFAPGEGNSAVQPCVGFALGSADAVDALTARLVAADYRVLALPRRTHDGRYESVVLDPDGHPVALTV
jgi:hypothetical protein